MADEIVDAVPAPAGGFVTFGSLTAGQTCRRGGRVLLIPEAGGPTIAQSLDSPWWVFTAGQIPATELVEKLALKFLPV